MRSSLSTRSIAVVGLFLLGTVPATAAFGQDTARVLAKQGDRYLVLIRSDTLIAFPLPRVRKLLGDERAVADANLRAALSDSLIARYDSTARFADKTLTAYKLYIQALEEQLVGYRELVSRYRKLSGGSRVALDLGLGATNDQKPALLAGLAMWKLRVWTFLQEKNAGGMVGVSFPLF